MAKPSKPVEVGDVPPSDFEAGAVYALTLFRSRVQARIDEIREAERNDKAGVSVMLNGARDLLATVLSNFEHTLHVGLRAAEESHKAAMGDLPPALVEHASKALRAGRNALGMHGPCRSNNCSDCRRADRLMREAQDAIAASKGGK